MKKVLQFILHLLGFPLLIGLVVLINLPIIEGGIGYGLMVFVGIIITVVMALIYYIAFICLVKSKKKSKLKQTITLILIVFFCLSGLWLVADVAIPDFFQGATSGTVFYEDLVDNYQARAIVHEDLLAEYIRRAYNAQNLPYEPVYKYNKKGEITGIDTDDNGNNKGEPSLKDYLAEGYANENVQKLLTIQFASIDKDGYASFVEPWIAMANDDRLTIPTLIHLLTDDRTATMENVDYALYDEALKEVKSDPVMWNVLDMMGKPMDLELDMTGVNIAGLDLGKLMPTLIKMVSADVANIIGDEDILGSPIYLEYEGTTLSLVPSNESRGVLDYMSMAWLNNNGLLYAVVTLLSVRNLFLLFAGWMILTNFLIGLLRGMGKETNSLVKIKGGKGKDKNDKKASPERNVTVLPNGYRYGYVDVPATGYIDYGAIRNTLIKESRSQMGNK